MWRVLTLAAVWWPSHIAGMFDGAPLDTAAECVLVGLVVPALMAALFVAESAGAMVTRGWGHEGRFSIHLYGAATALVVWAVATFSTRLSGATAVDAVPRPYQLPAR